MHSAFVGLFTSLKGALCVVVVGVVRLVLVTVRVVDVAVLVSVVVVLLTVVAVSVTVVLVMVLVVTVVRDVPVPVTVFVISELVVLVDWSSLAGWVDMPKLDGWLGSVPRELLLMSAVLLLSPSPLPWLVCVELLFSNKLNLVLVLVVPVLVLVIEVLVLLESGVLSWFAPVAGVVVSIFFAWGKAANPSNPPVAAMPSTIIAPAALGCFWAKRLNMPQHWPSGLSAGSTSSLLCTVCQTPLSNTLSAASTEAWCHGDRVNKRDCLLVAAV